MPGLKVLSGQRGLEAQERTGWSEDFLGHKKNKWRRCAALFSGIGVETPAEGSERAAGSLLGAAMNSELLLRGVAAALAQAGHRQTCSETLPHGSAAGPHQGSP